MARSQHKQVASHHPRIVASFAFVSEFVGIDAKIPITFCVAKEPQRQTERERERESERKKGRKERRIVKGSKQVL